MIKVNIKRKSGKPVMLIDAKPLHEILDAIGVQKSADGTKYLDRPYCAFSVANSSYKMSTEVLLDCRYPAEFDLSGLWTNPPRTEDLQRLAESAHEQARKILDHYQPIDISVEIQKKVLK